MTSQWNTKAISKNVPPGGMAPSGTGDIMGEAVVILMQGKNTFGDRIFSYLKITLRDLKRMQAAVQAGQPFSPSDFGTVLAAGKGEPTPEQRAEISSMYKILDNKSESAAAAAPPPAPKAWDEY